MAEAGASVNVLVCEHADGTHRYLTTQVTEIYAAEDAAVSVYTLEETREGNHRFSNVYVEQQARSRVSLNGFSFTMGVSRTMTNVRLLGTGADCQTAGVAITTVASMWTTTCWWIMWPKPAPPTCSSNMCSTVRAVRPLRAR